MQNLNDLTIQQIVDRFKQFGTNRIVRIQQTYKKDQDNDLVPYVVATFGEIEYSNSQYQKWCPLFVFPNGNEILIKNDFDYESIKNEDAYECYEFSYDCDLKSILINLYTNIYKRKHKEN